MPELPEIETVKRLIGPLVTGRRIVSTKVYVPRMIAHPDTEGFVTGTEGRTAVSCGRRGKALIIELDRGRIIIRFGMTGQLTAVPCETPPEKHTHVEFLLDDGTALRYSDPRRFGALWYIAAGEDDVYSGISRMGPEPFDRELTGRYLGRCLGKRRIPVKEGLMDQSAAAGLGNIWADEILFRCRLCPETLCCDVSGRKWTLLAKTIPEMMDFAIDKNATTLEKYLEGLGRKYYDTSYLQVYGRRDEPCPVCGTAIVRSAVNGRSSYWCPKCQRPYRSRKGNDSYKA